MGFFYNFWLSYWFFCCTFACIDPFRRFQSIFFIFHSWGQNCTIFLDVISTAVEITKFKNTCPPIRNTSDDLTFINLQFDRHKFALNKVVHQQLYQLKNNLSFKNNFCFFSQEVFDWKLFWVLRVTSICRRHCFP